MHWDLLPLTPKGSWEASNEYGIRGKKDRIGICNGPENFTPTLHSVSTQMAKVNLNLAMGKGSLQVQEPCALP